MKIAPVSADLLIKAALIGAAVLAIVWGARKVAGAAGAAASDVYDSVTEAAATTFNPASDQNFVYGGVNALGGYVSGSQDWNLGGWIYDITHADPLANPPPPRNTGGASGSW